MSGLRSRTITATISLLALLILLPYGGNPFPLSPPPPSPSYASFSLVGEGFSSTVREQSPPSDIPDDEVSDLYSTSLRSFCFSDDGNADCAVDVRQTSFSLGKLGSSVWGSSISLASFLYKHRAAVKGKRVLELGAGCGLPGLACAKLCGASSVTLTDFWEDAAESGPSAAEEGQELVRLLPSPLFATNLGYNVRLNGLGEVRGRDERRTQEERRSDDRILHSNVTNKPLLVASLLPCSYLLLITGGFCWRFETRLARSGLVVRSW